MKRNSKGQFSKKPVKLGTLVVNLGRGFQPGFTKNKVYKVVQTCGSKPHPLINERYHFPITNDYEFFVIDDDGLLRYAALGGIPNVSYDCWEVING